MTEPAASPRPPIPRGVWVLGFVSLFMDVSSEMIHSLLPLFLVSGLGASMLMVGVVEGMAEATALVVKVFSGALSDWIGRRKGLALLGYGLGAVAKPLFALAGGVGLVIAARFIDRVGKGIRGAPRDAMVADLSPPAIRGAAFGLRQSLDTVGAFSGPLLATALMLWWAGDFRAVFWAACLPALICVLLLAVGVKEPERPPAPPAGNPLRREALAQLGAPFWRVALVGAVFTLARFSEAFLVLRAQDLGMTIALVPLVMVAMNLAYAVCAFPFGRLADRVDHRLLLAAGVMVLVIADCLLGLADHLAVLLAGVLLWGVHLGMTQGLLSAMVAEVAPAHLRGTAFGLFNLACGAAMLLASVLAGALWDAFGARVTFLVGAALCVLALLTIATLRAPRRSG